MKLILNIMLKIILTIISLSVIYYLLRYTNINSPHIGIPVCIGVVAIILCMYIIWMPYRRTFFL